MILYPMIELLDGRCVSLFRGRTDEPHIWHLDPVATAKSFAESGADWLQITDFDAMSGDERNADLIREIIRTVGIPVLFIRNYRGFRKVSQLRFYVESLHVLQLILQFADVRIF